MAAAVSSADTGAIAVIKAACLRWQDAGNVDDAMLTGTAPWETIGDDAREMPGLALFLAEIAECREDYSSAARLYVQGFQLQPAALATEDYAFLEEGLGEGVRLSEILQHPETVKKLHVFLQGIADEPDPPSPPPPPCTIEDLADAAFCELRSGASNVSPPMVHFALFWTHAFWRRKHMSPLTSAEPCKQKTGPVFQSVNLLVHEWCTAPSTAPAHWQLRLRVNETVKPALEAAVRYVRLCKDRLLADIEQEPCWYATKSGDPMELVVYELGIATASGQFLPIFGDLLNEGSESEGNPTSERPEAAVAAASVPSRAAWPVVGTVIVTTHGVVGVSKADGW